VSDRPALSNEEIEVTPEMTAAGYWVLCNSGIGDEYLKADKVLVAEIFATMWASRPREMEGSYR
jgi:hypothetical protein